MPSPRTRSTTSTTSTASTTTRLPPPPSPEAPGAGYRCNPSNPDRSVRVRSVWPAAVWPGSTGADGCPRSPSSRCSAPVRVLAGRGLGGVRGSGALAGRVDGRQQHEAVDREGNADAAEPEADQPVEPALRERGDRGQRDGDLEHGDAVAEAGVHVEEG